MDLKIKIPKPKKSFKKGSLVINPEAYWDGVLFLVLIVIVFAFAFGFFLFRKVGREFTLSKEEMKNIPLVREEKLSETLKYFREREKKSAEVIVAPAPIVDPSL